ncbi:MAG: ECF RNA polymerase sigma factor EcfG [Pseudorhodoplanes sp.]|nr:ECF RNA polymerase sigma factor EcfG [Pseudorhodoplanes sp.]
MAGERQMSTPPTIHEAMVVLLPRLVAFARTLLGDPDHARDLVQEAVTRALAAERVPADPAAYRAWMFRIVRNAAIDELRRRREQVSDSAIVPDIWGFDEACIAKITVGQGLTALSAAHREIIGLIDIAGFSYAEAAAFLDLPPGTVMSRLARARSLLLAAIEASTVRPMKANKGRRS